MKNLRLPSPLVPALLFALLLPLSACGLADIRPDSMHSSPITETSAEKGRALLAHMAEAHGGLANYKSKRSLEVTFVDHWEDTLARTFVSPWPEDGQVVAQTLIPLEDNSMVEFIGGPEAGNQWGIQNWATYTRAKGQAAVFEEDTTIKFWLPTAGYFFEAPFRLGEAEVVHYLGKETIEEKEYEAVFLSWGTDEPQDTIDQYIVYLDPDTHRLAFLSYTVRDMMANITGTMTYTDYTTVEGIVLPKKLSAGDGPNSEALHWFEVMDFVFNKPADEVVPEPARKGHK